MLAQNLQLPKLIMSLTLKDKIRDIEKRAITEAMGECGWIQARAAKKLGITERMIGYKIKKYGIEIKEVDCGDAKLSSTEAAAASSSSNH